MPRPDATRLPRVGYVLKKYPRLSETFILNEILGHEAAGVHVSIYSLRMPDDGRFHADLASVRACAQYLPEFKSLHAYEAIRQAATLGSAAGPAIERAQQFLDLLPESRRCALLVQGLHLSRQVQRERIDHLHAHFMTIAAHVAYLAHCFTGVSFSVTAHAKDIFRHTVNAEVFRTVANAAARIITVTDFNRKFIADTYLEGNDANVTRIYNGLPVAALRELADAERPPAGESPSPRHDATILAVGRLVEKKGFHVLLHACRQLADRGVRFQCRIVGDGEDADRLTSIRDQLGLSEQVCLTGPMPREGVLAEMSRATLLAAPCIPSEDGNQDALPTVLLEALAVGLPCIATRLSGIPEIIDDGVDGILCAPGNSDELATAIEDLLGDAARRDAFAASGKEKVLQRFDRRKTLPELIDVFASSLQPQHVPEVVA